MSKEHDKLKDSPIIKKQQAKPNTSEYSPLTEGWQAKPDGVFITYKDSQTKPDGVLEENNNKGIYKTYKSLPYNPKLKERAKQLRKAGNLSEVLFWNQVKRKKFLALDFHRQKIIGNYIVDFYCPKLNLVIEIDGSSHNGKIEYDKIREQYLKSLKLEMLHFTDIDIKQNLNGVMQYLAKYYEEANTPSLRDTPLTGRLYDEIKKRPLLL